MSTLQEQGDAIALANAEIINRDSARYAKFVRELKSIADDEYQTLGRKLFRIKEIRDEMIAVVKPLATACVEGCSNCCHMAVGITSMEAEDISYYTGVPMAPVGSEEYKNEEADILALMGQTCPFLFGGRCSVYEVRPLACRTHFNISGISELCNVKTNPTGRVANYNFQPLWLTQAMVLAPHVEFGELRSFFPPEVVLEHWDGTRKK